jgi:hypothetical protein
VVLASLELSSAKEMVLRIEMEEEVITHRAVTIQARNRKDQPLNEMAYISARTFTIDETMKYPGSLGDPARMASVFAGVSSAGDQVNDIVIRGNTPTGLLWRLEGVNIPNPNHFGKLGSSGGPVSMLNNNTLSNSDFYTGAFPAEFGNALSGVFDLRMRPGNNEKREYLFQVGANGFELGMEGPFTKKHGSSYMVNYRYSTFRLIELTGIQVGFGALPYYQDINLKLNFPLKKSHYLSFFALGGKNTIEYFDTLRAAKSLTLMNGLTGLAGLSYNTQLNKHTRLIATLSASYVRNEVLDTTHRSGYQHPEWYGNRENEVKYTFNLLAKNKINAANNLNGGLIFDWFDASYADSSYNLQSGLFYHDKQQQGEFGLLQAYAEWKHKFGPSVSLNTGLHFNYFSLNSHISAEPRLGFVWDMRENQSLSFGYGLHSQIQPRAFYFLETLTDTSSLRYQMSNKSLGFSKSHHLIGGYSLLIRKNLRFKTEAYYQYLFNIPIESHPSYYSLINYGSFIGTEADSLVNKGTGRNYGIDLTLEKFLSKHLYFLITASFFNSKYKGSDGVERNTLFNTNYVVNLIGGYEYTFAKHKTIGVDLRTVWSGGLRKLPIDMDASALAGKTVYDYEHAFENRYKDYLRFDLKISFKYNRPRVSHHIAIDIMNLTDKKNHFIERYDPAIGETYEGYTIGIIPVIFWRMLF